VVGEEKEKAKMERSIGKAWIVMAMLVMSLALITSPSIGGTAPHDVAVTNALPFKPVVGIGPPSTENISTTFENHGQNSETFNVTLSAQPTKERGMVGCWNFDEGTGTKVHDGSGNRIDGTVNGATWINGLSEKALSFDGDDYVLIENTAAQNFESGCFTLESWVRFINNNNDNAIIAKHESGYSNGYFIGIRNNEFDFLLGNEQGLDRLQTSETYADGQWHHVVGVYDRPHQYLYVDGTLKAQRDINYSQFNFLDISIGRVFNAGYLNGDVDEAKIYIRALSTKEVRQEYEKGTSTVGYWKFDEGSGTTAYDSSGNNRNGTLVNMDPVASWVNGKYGKALQFDGINDYVDISNSSDLNFQGNYTVSFWMRTTSTSRNMLVAKHISGYPNGWCFTINEPAAGPNKLTFFYGTDLWVVANKIVNDGVWHFITGVVDYANSLLLLYIDGELDKSGSITGTFTPNTENIKFGSYSQGGSYFNGLLDEVRIYNRSLTAEEIRGLAGVKGPVGYWNFDEGKGIVAADSSGNGNDGNLSYQIIDDFNDGNFDGWTLGWTGGTQGSIVSGYEGSYAFRIWPAGNNGNYLGYATRIINATAGQCITFACRGSGDDVFWLRVWNGSQYIDSGEGQYGHAGDGNWHVCSTRIDYTQNNVAIFLYCNGIGSWAEYDFIVQSAAWTDGRIGKALKFDGVDDYLRIYPFDDSSIAGGTKVTMCAWIKVNTLSSSAKFISAGSYAWQLSIYQQRLGMEVWTAGPSGWGDSLFTIVPELDRWYFLCGVYDDGVMRVYIDGNLSATKTHSYGGPLMDIDAVELGRTVNFDGGYFNGTIDEVKVYSRSLSAQEIWAEYIDAPIIIWTRTVTLDSGSNTTLTFTWNTTGFTKGKYNIRAYAEPVYDETSTSNNNLICGWVEVSILGDINGPDGYPDGKVNLLDVFSVALAYGSYPGHPTWNPNYDINNDGKINLIDYFTTALNYGKTDP